MTLSTGAIAFAFLCFIATFVAARVLGRGFRERRAQKAREAADAKAMEGASRQVRRARQRKGR